MTTKKRHISSSNIIQLLVSILVIILVNILGSHFFTRLDLTSEKRYTLSPSTREMLRELDDIVYFRVYLEGDFPAGFQRLRNSTREMLDEFRAFSDNIQYEFINPNRSDQPAERIALHEELMHSGLIPTDVFETTAEGRRQQMIFPGAIVNYKQRQLPVQFLASAPGNNPDLALNRSIEQLEYNIASVIRRLTTTERRTIAFIKGHGELPPLLTAGARQVLSEYYTVEYTAIDGQLNSLANRVEVDTAEFRITNRFDAIIIAKPEHTFSERDKFLIDQYIMRGGKVLWFIDPVLATMDSLKNADQTVGISLDLNLADQLFRYGVRLNSNLVMDINALPIPVITGRTGNQPQHSFLPWYFFPLLKAGSDHPIVSDLDLVLGQFVSSIEPVQTPDVEATVLLTTSQYSRALTSPVLISLEVMRDEPDKNLFIHGNLPVAVLLEGRFQSLYSNRIPPQIAGHAGIGFLEESMPTSMIVVADGDMIRNQLGLSQGNPLPLGLDQFTRQSFANSDFLLNA
ncbi:MAG TPA: gliding motility-associated ABC transporter substrate-binding protein GldG, partial [Bacteroidales bacterium]|nr:gliding motility-associated ABC transporter substrate-binding protein GldG [Bacteroidales bacterium]